MYITNLSNFNSLDANSTLCNISNTVFPFRLLVLHICFAKFLENVINCISCTFAVVSNITLQCFWSVWWDVAGHLFLDSTSMNFTWISWDIVLFYQIKSYFINNTVLIVPARWWTRSRFFKFFSEFCHFSIIISPTIFTSDTCLLFLISSPVNKPTAVI